MHTRLQIGRNKRIISAASVAVQQFIGFVHPDPFAGWMIIHIGGVCIPVSLVLCEPVEGSLMLDHRRIHDREFGAVRILAPVDEHLRFGKGISRIFT